MSKDLRYFLGLQVKLYEDLSPACLEDDRGFKKTSGIEP